MEYEDITKFWFEEATPKQRFTKDADLDAKIRTRFLDTLERVSGGETKEWRAAPEGRLAEIIVLDQFSRNIFRGTPRAFAYDDLAFSLAREAIEVGDDKKLSGEKRYFIYLPFMHSESKEVHSKAIWLFLSLPLKNWWSWINYEYKHKKIIDRFGRYPHRNEALGRTSTSEEIEFLKNNPGF